MTIVRNDGVGNYYIGDCLWSNHRSGNTLKFLNSQPLTGLSALLTTLSSTCGFSSYSGIPSESSLNSIVGTLGNLNYFHSGGASVNSLIKFTPQGESLASGGRFTIGTSATVLGVKKYSGIMNNAGAVIMSSDNNYLATETLYSVSSTLESGTQVVICADSKSFSIFSYRCVLNTGVTYYQFTHLGELKNINPNGSGYYNGNVINRSVALSCNHSHSEYKHYILENQKVTLQNGKAEYPINCLDNTVPNSNWATNFLVFDNNSTTGYPAIGEVRNMLLTTAIGLTIGKPVYVDGTAVTDGGSRWYLPVGYYADKTMLMRCYSSVVVS